MNDHVAPLYAWLSRRAPLRAFHDLASLTPDLELGGFVGLSARVPLHEIPTLPAVSLDDSWAQTNEYVSRSLNLIGGNGGWLDREEVEMIESGLGGPPPRCQPIYVFSVTDGANERAVYVGRTSSQTPRFSGGHAAAVDLHHPRYNGMMKQVYLAYVLLLTKDDYLPLEWVRPLNAAKAILAAVEATLIFGLQPELNERLRAEYRQRISITLSIENCVQTNFLQGHQFAF